MERQVVAVDTWSATYFHASFVRARTRQVPDTSCITRPALSPCLSLAALPSGPRNRDQSVLGHAGPVLRAMAPAAARWEPRVCLTYVDRTSPSIIMHRHLLAFM
jgi:hypothetical protein